MRQPRESPGPARGILRLPSEQGSHAHHRILPRPELRELIEHFWGVSWSLPTPQLVETLGHPTVHLVFEDGSEGRRAEVAGVPLSKFSRALSGTGSVFGIKLRPAAFRAICTVAAHRLTGKVSPLAEVLPELAPLEQQIFSTPSIEERVRLAEGCLLACRPIVLPEIAALRDLVETIAADPELIRVEQLVELAAVDRRTLERRFRDAVGVTPKWVIRRYRLHEATERLRRGDLLIAVAHELGYADQAHFSRDFKAAVGLSPQAFVKRERSAALR